MLLFAKSDFFYIKLKVNFVKIVVVIFMHVVIFTHEHIYPKLKSQTKAKTRFCSSLDPINCPEEPISLVSEYETEPEQY